MDPEEAYLHLFLPSNRAHLPALMIIAKDEVVFSRAFKLVSPSDEELGRFVPVGKARAGSTLTPDPIRSQTHLFPP